MRKLFLLSFISIAVLQLQAQTYTSGLTATGTGTATNVRLGGANPLLLNTTIDLGTFTFGLKTTALPNLFTVLNNGSVGIGISPTSLFHLKAGTATLAPLKFTSGASLTTASAGAMEYDGTSLFFTPSTVRKTILFNDFTNIAAGSTLAAINGGTGQTTLATGDLLYASAANTFAKRTIGTTGQVLTVVGGIPAWATPAAGGITSVFGRTGIVVAAANDYTFAQIGAKPTTLAGYGITDAAALSHTHAIDVLSNVTIATPVNNQVLTYNSTSAKWENKAAIAGGSGWGLTGNAATAPVTNFIGTTDAQRLVFKTNALERATILSNGYVGIGTSTPATALHVAGDFTLGGRAIFDNGFGFPTISVYQFNAPANTISAGFGSGSNIGLTANDYSTALRFNGSGIGYGDFQYYPNGGGNGNQGNFRFSITGSAVNTTPTGKLGVGEIYSAGNVGIGTTSPTQLLQVVGNSDPTVIVKTTGTSIAQMLVGDGSNNFGLQYYPTGNCCWPAGTAALTTGSSAGNLVFQTLNPIQFYINNQERARFSVTGNLGLGTSTPTEKLDVAGNIYTNGKILINQANTAAVAPYSLAVNGSAIFTKAVVKLNAAWPDYVFKSTYKLPSLNELEKYLQNNQHLPEVPSATEVEKNGIDLGSNQAILLKKVEELTLYIIGQQKQMEIQQKQIDELKKLIKK
jgi:hypothetical protein